MWVVGTYGYYKLAAMLCTQAHQ